MATILTENILSTPNSGSNVNFTNPESLTNTETFSFIFNDSNDDFYIIADASASAPGNYTITFAKGDFPSAKAPAVINFTDSQVYFIMIESGMIGKDSGIATFTLTTTITGGLANTGIKLAVVKKRFVKNN
ncbi:MAG: hypothetical protein A2Y15_05645 [Clostridiales bacterium GWF2_36_10]|nr:MAG: hypothetical protein A2Y15_05645 [Clostridiales bacterium GWF2_36_10]HAN21973.1 hypothetical protein [Clostridiales bacterium]